MYGYLILLRVCSTAGLQCWLILFDNFAVHGVGLDNHHMGSTCILFGTIIIGCSLWAITWNPEKPVMVPRKNTGSIMA